METGGKRFDQSRQHLTKVEPLLTIITVVKNCDRTIANTILSVIGQECLNLEYIVIDGSSTDSTLEIIKKYDKDVDFWMSEPDNGIYDAMNKGISYATGRYINFMNAGDVYCDNQVCNKVIEKIQVDDSDIFYGDFVNWDKISGLEIVIKAKPVSKIWRGMICSHQSAFIKKSALEKTHFNVKYKLSADYEQFLKLFTLNHSFSQLRFPVSKTDVDGISYSNLGVIYEDIKIIHSFKPFSYHILYFIPYIFIAFFRKMIGLNLTTRARAIKWKYLQYK